VQIPTPLQFQTRMPPHVFKRGILVFFVSVSVAAFVVTSPADAQTADNGDLLKYLQIGAPQKSPAQKSVPRTPAARGSRPAATPDAAPVRAPLPQPAFASSTVPVAKLNTPAAFYRAVRAIDSQRDTAPAPTFVSPPPVSPARPPASTDIRRYPWPRQPAGATASKAVQPAGQLNVPSKAKNLSILSTDYLLSYPENLWRIVSAPVNFDTNDWLIAGGVAGTTGLLLLADKELNDTWRDDIRSGTVDDFLDVMELFGSSRFIVLGSVAGYAAGEVVGSPQAKEASLLVAQSFVLSAGFTQGMKFAFRRDRPDDSRDDQYSFFSSTASKTNSSFASGHATNAFSLASVLTEVYSPNAPWLGWVLYPIATATALARVNNERHWASDVFLGSALGYFIGKMVVRFSPFRGNPDVSVVPLTDGDTTGLKIVHRL
jgi:hypothetical protein